MNRWYEQASVAQVHATPVKRAEAMDELLDMVQAIGRRLQEQSGQAFDDATEIAREHGVQRLEIGWNVVELARDYEVLHVVALEHLGAVLDQRLAYRQAMVLATVIERGVGSAVEALSQLAQERLKAELRQVTLHLADAEYYERQRIAQQLHDDLQQLLVAMQLKLQTALNDSSPDRSKVKQALDLTQHTIEVTRYLTGDLYPKDLESQKLPAAIEQPAETFQQRYNLNVTVHCEADPESNPDGMPLRRLLYDAVRELLLNVVKHAQADEAWVKIAADGQSPWSIEVGDHGVGTPDVSAAESGIGLASVRQRIEQVGGTVSLHSKQGEGTRVVLIVPVEAK